MWPWGHLAIAYLCYVGYTRMRSNPSQTPAAVGAVVLGSQVPDLIDKTLAWSVPLLPSGRSLGHSLLTVTLLIAVLYTVVSSDKHESVTAFGIGLVSHAVVDLGPEVVIGLMTGESTQWQWTTYLIWPLLAPPPYTNDESFRPHLLGLELDPYMVFQLGLFVIAIAVWVASGAPGRTRIRTGTTASSESK